MYARHNGKSPQEVVVYVRSLYNKAMDSELGIRLRKERIAQGHTQQQLATAAGLSTKTVLEAEKGNASRWSVVKIVRVLGLNPADYVEQEAAS